MSEPATVPPAVRAHALGELRSAIVANSSPEQLVDLYGSGAVSTAEYERAWNELHEPTEVKPWDEAEETGQVEAASHEQRLAALEAEVARLRQENDLLDSARTYLIGRLNHLEHMVIAKWAPNFGFH